MKEVGLNRKSCCAVSDLYHESFARSYEQEWKVHAKSIFNVSAVAVAVA